MANFNKYSISLITILFLLLSICLYNPKNGNCQESFSKIIKNILPSVVTIITYGRNNKRLKIGSGFFVNKNGDVITNFHVVKNASRIEIITFDERRYNVRGIVSDNKMADLIQIATNVPSNKVKSLNITKKLPKIGDRILVLGSPLGFEQTVSDGLISGIREIPTFGKIIQISAPVSPGSSGGPVVNLNGEVVGIATFQIIAGQNLNFAIPSSFLLSLKKREKPYVRERIKPSNLMTNKKVIKVISTKLGDIAFIKQGLFGCLVKLNNKIIYKSQEWITSFHTYFNELGKYEAILIQESSATRAWFRLILLRDDGLIKVTDQFGTGSDYISVDIKGDEITFKFPDMKNKKDVYYIFSKGSLSKVAN